TPEQFVIGSKIKVVGDGEEIEYYLRNNEFEIVGIVLSPYWISYERGATTAGSGKLGDFVYIANDVFQSRINYYSEAYVTLNGTEGLVAYSDEYNAYIEQMQSTLLQATEPIVKERAAILGANLPAKLASAQSQIAAAEADVNSRLAEGRAKIAEYRELEKTGEAQLAAAKAELDRKYAEAQGQLESGSSQYMAAVNEYNAKITTVANKRAEHTAKLNEYNVNKTAADSAKQQLDTANTELLAAKLKIETTEALITSTQSTLDNIKNNQNVSQEELDLDLMAERLDQTNPELANILRNASNLTAQGMAADVVVETEQLLDQYNTELVIAEGDYQQGKIVYDEKYAEWSAADQQLQAAKIQLDSADAQLKTAESQLAQFKDQIQSSGFDLQFGSLKAQTEYNNAQTQLTYKTMQLQNIQQTLEKAEKQIAEAEAEAEEKMSLVKTEYNKGVSLLETIRSGPSWSVYERGDSPGYTGYGEAAKNMQRLAYIFPTFFFIVSTLVCLTTMTRLVEEQRTQLGTMKALGYEDKTIVSKYLIYASLASTIGSIVGVLAGFSALPHAIFAAWGIMYEIPSLRVQLIPVYIVLGILISVGLTTLAAYISCVKELKTPASILMRPKPPKDGKRVYLERIPAIWSRLNFTSKVTVRNLFRNKKRFAVTVIGIAGCTALMLSAFGLQNAIGTVITNQYGEEGVAQYDLQVVLKETAQGYTPDSEVVKNITGMQGIETSMLGFLKVCEGYSDRSDKKMEVDVLVPQAPEMLKQFVNLKSGKEDVPFTDEGEVITKKFAEKTKTEIGDTVKLSWTEGTKKVEYEVNVVGIADNYTFHYVYVTPATYYRMTNTIPNYNYLFCSITEDMSADAKTALETQIGAVNGVNGTVYTTVVIDNFNNIINVLNLVTLVFIVAAVTLAFVVLYNLNNININERIKELATLKVLGFYDDEVSAYIYRENVILSFFGIVIGLFLGVFLNIAVVSVVDIDTVTFSTTLKWWSYALAALCTVVFAIIVNVLMHFKLKKISMVESLKSVE
ncbi:MAG: FtsX-like permease family protein, partial [Clostridia bacterium]|nr:FtsX-like permease family protein [Clostridia bacterium]